MANVIPMAGEGTRFSKEGYTLPKPMIPVSGIPMILKVIRDLPPSNKWIFMVRQEHVEDYALDKLIKSELPDAIIVPVLETTEGQACTCMLAEPHLDDDEEVFIAACDNGYIYNKDKYDELRADKKVDSILWTFTQRETLSRNPTAWGWVNLEKDGLTIDDMSVKVPVSDDPFNDHAVVATFWFRTFKDFKDSVNLMIKEDYRIKNEFYVDSVPVFMKKLGKRTVIFDVEHYLGWGTPADLYDYQKLEYFVKYEVKPKGISKEDERLFPLWKRYFEQ
ncbi:nucleotidyltransferase [Nanoarchaeota archaeon]